MADSSPYEESIPMIDCRQDTLFRCKRCKGYVNPNWVWVNNGTAVICNLCKLVNKVPDYYYNNLNERGDRVDRDERPELNKGSYEFLAPEEY